MFSPAQQASLTQLNNLFAQLESSYTTQQLEVFHNSWYSLSPYREFMPEDQHKLSLEREKRFRSIQHHNGI